MDLYPNYKTLFLFLENFSKSSEEIWCDFSRSFMEFSDFGSCFPGKNIQLNFMSTVGNLDFISRDRYIIKCYWHYQGYTGRLKYFCIGCGPGTVFDGPWSSESRLTVIKCLPVKVMWGMMSRLIEWHRESIIVWTTLTEKSTYFYSCLKKNSKLTYFTSIWSRILFPKSHARLQKAK